MCILRSGLAEIYEILFCLVVCRGVVFNILCKWKSWNYFQYMGTWESNSSYQVWWQVPLSAEPSYRWIVHNELIVTFSFFFVTFSYRYIVILFISTSPISFSYLLYILNFFLNLCFGEILYVWLSKFH